MPIEPKLNKRSPAKAYLESLNRGPITFGQLLCAIREGEELSQDEFGKKLKLSRQKVCDFEKGRRLPSPELAAMFARRLGYSPESFARLVFEEQIKKAGLKLKVIPVA